MDQFVSIDIAIPKLLDWLLSRRHCKHDWRTHVVTIRSKINEAIQDMPENKEITNLLSGTYINYFHCVKIVEILKQTEADSKNIFGRYSSKRMKDWQEIINLYKKNNVYLAEAAELLINMVKYEIPSIKKQTEKQYQMEDDFHKKESDSIKSTKSTRHELNSLLVELGLGNSNASSFRESLVSTAKGLYSMNDEVANEIKILSPAIERYKSFTAISQPNQTVALNLMNYIIEKGNTTMYEWVKKVKPTKIVLPTLAYEDEVNEVNDNGIDWGYDIGDSDTVQIEVISSGTEEDTKSKEGDINENETVAEGELALSILDNKDLRRTLINELLELLSFLKTRLYECDNDKGIDELVESMKEIEELSTSTEKILHLLTNNTVQYYFNILYFPKYLDVVLKKIQMKESAIDRHIAITEMSQERSKEAKINAKALSEKTEIMVKKSRELQNEICNDISQRYSGREVYLMGGAKLN